MSSNIYQQSCPECAALLSWDTTRCECGRTFETHNLNADSLPSAQTLDEEELYASYLAARLEQAAIKLDTKRTELSTYPKNFDSAMEVMRALQEVRTARGELDAQTAKVGELRARLAATTGAPASAPRAQERASTDVTAVPQFNNEDEALHFTTAQAALRAALTPRTIETLLSARPDETFRARQSARADEIMATRGKQCPICGEQDGHDAACCACGSAFEGEGVPASRQDDLTEQPR